MIEEEGRVKAMTELMYDAGIISEVLIFSLMLSTRSSLKATWDH